MKKANQHSHVYFLQKKGHSENDCRRKAVTCFICGEKDISRTNVRKIKQVGAGMKRKCWSTHDKYMKKCQDNKTKTKVGQMNVNLCK